MCKYLRQYTEEKSVMIKQYSGISVFRYVILTTVQNDIHPYVSASLRISKGN
jgi:hypothetical protein